jgi:pilus assembly protein CpaF
MIIIAPSCDTFKRAVITKSLSALCLDIGTENIISDFSMPDTFIFWDSYKSNVKFAEDIFPKLSSINPKMLKKFLSSTDGNTTLCLKEKNINEIDIERINYLIDVLDNIFKISFIIPDEISESHLSIIKKAKNIILPFEADIISIKKAVSISDFYLSQGIYQSNIIPIILESEYDFHCRHILNEKDLFKKTIEIDFNQKLQNSLYSYQFETSYFPPAFKTALNKVIEIINTDKKDTVLSQDISNNYFCNESTYKELFNKVHSLLIEDLKEFAEEKDSEVLKQIASNKISAILENLNLQLPKETTKRLFKELCDNVAGLGILEDLINDNSITEIMVNGPNNIYTEKAGRIIRSQCAFQDAKSLALVIDRIVAQTGRHIDEASPIVDARLKDGSRVNAVIKPIALNGAALTIRKFLKNIRSSDALVESGAMSIQMQKFLKLCVSLRKNIIISGGTGTGKTTLLNAISSFISEEERIVTIEDSAELQLSQEHVIRLEARPKSTEGTGEISIRRLVVNALRMRPDRIIVGECRSGETLDMLQAMNTGHEGSMSTIHANSEKDAISRISTMVMMSGADLPEKSILNQIVSAVDIIVQLSRYFDGSRRVSSISILTDSENSPYEINQVFKFNPTGIKNAKQAGVFKSLGFIPAFIKEANGRGIDIDMEIFK